MATREGPGPVPAGAAFPTQQTAGKQVPAGSMAGDQASPKMRRGLHLGDELPAGAPGAGENICRTCQGSGRADGGTCPTCGGTGKVIESVAGGP